MSITAEMREAWAPHCTGPWARINLYGDGIVTVRASTVPAWEAFSNILKKHKYKTRREDTGAYNCRVITGGTRYSLHAYGIAVDINWQSNPYGNELITDIPIELVEDVEAVRTNSGARVFRWGGRYAGNKDAMHFEIICTPDQLATGISSGQVDPPTPPIEPPVVVPPKVPTTDTVNHSEVDMYIALVGVGFFAQVGNVTIPLEGISLGDFGALTSGPNRAPVMILPAAVAEDFTQKTMMQTAAAMKQ